MRFMHLMAVIAAMLLLVGTIARADDRAAGQTYRLYEGITAYVNNPEGKDFSVRLDLRDINLMSQGPREMMLKVYDPEGRPVVREMIPDDGITEGAFPEQMGGWCEELQYYMSIYATGSKPSFRWSAWSDPKRLQAIAARTFEHKIKGSAKGIYRIVLVGTSDHFATLKISPDLKYGIVGHPNWMHGSRDLLKKSYIYIPKGTSGVFFAIAEPDQPYTRTFRLTAPDGKVLFEGKAAGGYVRLGGQAWKETPLKFEKPEEVEGKLLTLDVSDGANDYLVRLTLQQPKEGIFNEYVGMGSLAVFCDTPELAMALKGGTFVEDGLVFWHPLQARFHRWLKAHPFEGNVPKAPLSSNDARKADAATKPAEPPDPKAVLRSEIEGLFASFRLLETSDGRGTALWTNWNYALGYYGCRIWKRGWVLMKDPNVPDDLKEIIKEGLIMAGDRLSFAVTTEAVNGNAFAQIPVGLWYGQAATGDPILKQRFEIFWDRWVHEGWGPGLGVSKSGDAQEFLAHDMHYGSYIMDNWKAKDNTWVREGGILGDAGDDKRFQKVMDRYYQLYTYLYCRESGPDKRAVAANPWSARTHMHPHKEATNWEAPERPWKGEPGPDLTVSVNDGDEWFAARRKGYYAVTFHGRITPEWKSRAFPGQLGFGGGILCQLTVPGKGPVLVSTQTESYGTGMDPSNWRNMRLHTLAGELWDGRPIISAISIHDDAKLNGNTVTSSGEVRNAHVKAARSFTFAPDGIDCSVQLATSDYIQILQVWSWARNWSEVKVAYEMIPFMPKDPAGKDTKVTLMDAAGKEIGPATTTPTEAHSIRIDRGGFGVDIKPERPLKILLGGNSTVMMQLVDPDEKPAIAATAPAGNKGVVLPYTPAEKVGLKYRLVPFGN